VPLVSVFWISGYRGTSVVQLIDRFLKQTYWPKLELLVVDWSVGDDPLRTRDHLKNYQHIDRLLLRDQAYCVFNNTNHVRGICRGQFILGFEDDSRLVEGVSPDWLEKMIEQMTSDDIDDVNLWSLDYMPPTLAVLSRANPERPFPRYPEYPEEFSTISESQRLGNMAFRERYKSSGRKLIGIPCTETSLAIPGRNLAQLKDLTNLSWGEIDELSKSGVGLQRMSSVDFVQSHEYARLGGWQGMNWTIHGESSLQPIINRKSRRLKTLQTLSRAKVSLVIRLRTVWARVCGK
jgi:hypothetical protein